MKEMNETFSAEKFTEMNAEERLAVELEERQELAWIAGCEGACAIANG